MMNSNSGSDDIAIIGMSCRFPGAGSLQEFWTCLSAGAQAMTDFTDEELRGAGVPDDILRHPAYVKTGVMLENIEAFDAGFFGMSPREAEVTDPQHRIFLECAWEAL